MDWELGSKVLWICKTKPSFSTFTSLKSLLHEQCNRAFQGNSGHILDALRELTDNTHRTLRENSENSQITLGKHSEGIQRSLTSLAKGYLSLFCWIHVHPCFTFLSRWPLWKCQSLSQISVWWFYLLNLLWAGLRWLGQWAGVGKIDICSPHPPTNPPHSLSNPISSSGPAPPSPGCRLSREPSPPPSTNSSLLSQKTAKYHKSWHWRPPWVNHESVIQSFGQSVSQLVS